MKKILVAATLAGLALPSFAQSECSTIKSDQKRLACYDAASKPKPIQPQPSAPAVKGKWTYRTTKDEMNGTKEVTAVLDSENTIQLGFPYAGHNQPRLALRKNGKQNDVFVVVSKGQILCPLSECSIKVKFDDKPAARYSGTGPADHSSEIIFLEPARKFMDNVKKSQTVLIELNMYQNGTQLLKFSTAGLAWE